MRKFHPSMTQRLMGNVKKNNQLLKAGNRENLLNLAEYISLGSSVTGSIVAIVYQQLAYATVPLSLALSLNVLNRNRFQQQMRQDTSANVADVYQVVQSLHQQVHVLPAEPVDLDPINQSLEQLQQKTTTLTQQFNARPETPAIAQLTSQLAAVALRLDNLPKPPEPVDLSRIEAEIANQKAQLQAIDTSSITSSIAQLQTQLQTQIDQLLQQIQDLPSPFNPSVLDQRLTELERKNHSIFSDDVGSLASVVKNLQSDKAFIQQVLAHLISQLSAVADEESGRLEAQAIAQRTNLLEALAPQFYARLETQAFAQRPSQLSAVADEESARPDTQAIAHLTNQLNALALRLDNLPNPPEPVDLSRIEAEIATQKAQLRAIDLSPITSSIAQLQNQIDQQSQQTKNLPPPFDSSPLEQRIAQQENSYHTIVAECNSLVQLVEAKMATVHQSIASVQNSAAAAQVEAHQHFSQEIESLRTEVCALPTPTAPVDLSGIEAEISALKLESQVQIIDLYSVIDQLWLQIQDLPPSFDSSALEQRLTELESRNHSIFSDRNLDEIQQQLASLWQLVDESAKTTDLESALARLSAGIAGQVDTAIETQISQFRAQLTASLNERTKHLHNHTRNLDEIKQQLASREQRSKVG